MTVQPDINLHPVKEKDPSNCRSVCTRGCIDSPLTVEIGPMSWALSGDAGDLFAALRTAYQEVAQRLA